MAAPQTFPVDVDGIGTFTFRHRKMGDQIRIFADASRMLGGPVDDAEVEQAATALVTLALLTVSAPDGWSLDEVDPLDPDAVARVFTVYRRLREEEARFRNGAGAQRT